MEKKSGIIRVGGSKGSLSRGFLLFTSRVEGGGGGGIVVTLSSTNDGDNNRNHTIKPVGVLLRVVLSTCSDKINYVIIVNDDFNVPSSSALSAGCGWPQQVVLKGSERRALLAL